MIMMIVGQGSISDEIRDWTGFEANNVQKLVSSSCHKLHLAISPSIL